MFVYSFESTGFEKRDTLPPPVPPSPGGVAPTIQAAIAFKAQYQETISGNTPDFEFLQFKWEWHDRGPRIGPNNTWLRYYEMRLYKKPFSNKDSYEKIYMENVSSDQRFFDRFFSILNIEAIGGFGDFGDFMKGREISIFIRAEKGIYKYSVKMVL